MIQSLGFWLALAVTAVAAWSVPRRWRECVIALCSAGYLAYLSLEPVLILCLWGAAFYVLARPAGPDGEKAPRVQFWIPIVGILGTLAWFKYMPPLAAAITSDPLEQRILVPLGMSYFTFKLLHYAIEVRRGNITERDPCAFASWLFLFPIFTAGPIERYDHYLANREEHWSLRSTADGLTRIVHGLVKKMLFAEVLVKDLLLRGNDAAAVVAGLDGLSYVKVAGFLFLFFVYVYFDFSAYSDIGIGAARLFGIRIQENFNFPLIARDINEFWKRWHMSLSNWCQAYVYLPTIGLTRNPYLAVFSTFLVMGLWHNGSLTRIAWGLYQAVGVIAFTKWSQLKRRRRWKALKARPFAVLGTLITWAFLSGSAAFLAAEACGAGVWTALRILGRLVLLDLPA